MSTLSGEPGEVLDRFEVPSKPGNELLALARVAEAVQGSGLTDDQVERLKTAVAEATMNGIEHGNANREELPVEVKVVRTVEALIVSVTDQGGGRDGDGDGAEAPAQLPDLELKLAGLQPPRGWGLFLIGKMVDEVGSSDEDGRHTVRLVVHRPPGPERSVP
jgi:anti-sigma regulatory factor (Ser/Thr protein kinase)